jgi:hypothetical protein
MYTGRGLDLDRHLDHGGCSASRARRSGLPTLPPGTATQGAGLFSRREANRDEIGRLLELYTADRISYSEMLADAKRRAVS